MVINSLVQT